MNLGSCECIISQWDCCRKKTGPFQAALYSGYGAENEKTDPHSQLGFSGFVRERPSFSNFRIQSEYMCHRAITPVEDNIPSSPDVVVDEKTTQIIPPPAEFHKDLNSLPIGQVFSAMKKIRTNLRNGMRDEWLNDATMRPLSAINFPSSSDGGKKARVAYRGVPGSCSEAAALKAYPNCETVPCDQFEAVFKAVELWLVEKAVLPIDNSVGGSIHRSYDLLLFHRLHIVGEVKLIVNHCLLGLPGIRKEELKSVLSHPQALDQCKDFLNKWHLTRISAADTAGAAQIVASEGVRERGAIASARAAEIYGLNVLAERIQDDSDNITRFLILAREPIIPGTDKSYKTSIVFTLEEGPGVLFKALAVFAMRDINLSKIESRPQRRRPLRVVDDTNRGSSTYFDYLFYIDFEASMAEPRAQNALGHLQEFARFLRVLGCYPMDTNTVNECG
ncbi:ADP,ATP carrier protein [Orobanche gracilis]